MIEKSVSFKDNIESVSSDSTSSSISGGSKVRLLRRLRENGILLRITQGMTIIVFIVALISALYYAIREGEVKGVEIFHWSPTKTYSPLFTQFGENGKLTLVTVTKGDNDEEKEILYEFETSWIQDHQKKQIIHRVDDNTVAYVYKNGTYFAQIGAGQKGSQTKDCCFYWRGHGYLDYLISQGLMNMDDRHPVRTLDGQSVYVYDANPGLVIPHLNWDKFQRNVALLTQAFVDRKQGTLKAWQIHFSLPVLEKIEKGKEWIRRVEYWIRPMRRTGTLPKGTFGQLPEICQEK